MTSPDIKAVIFDFDDTLTKSFSIKSKQIIETGRRFYGLEIDHKLIQSLWGKDIKVLFETVFEQKSPYPELLANFKTLSDEFPMEPHEGAVEIIDYLEKKKYLLGILTASSNQLVLGQLERIGISTDKFFMIQTAEDTNMHKPDPKVFHPILSELANKYKISDPKQITYIGDAIRDYKAAIGNNLNFIGVTTGMTTVGEFESLNANCVESLKNLEKHLI